MSDNDSDDGYAEARYDCNVEEKRPSSVVYSDAFNDLKLATSKVAALLKEPLKNTKYRNAITEGLVVEVEKRTKENFPSQITFAIAGDMKAGKSSVINSLLSIGMIARKGDAGRSCTWVVSRYRSMFPNQASPFAALVRFFEPAQIRDILGSLLARYYRATAKEAKTEDDADGDTDDDTFGDIREAMTTFTSLFCELEEFESSENAHAYLMQAKSENDASLLDEMLQWSLDLISAHKNEHGRTYFESSSPAVLLNDLQPYTHQAIGEYEGLTATLWPLVRVVDFGLDNPLLNEGIVFVDSPGLSDSNRSRARNAALYHRKCTHRIAVADIGRAESDPALLTSLQTGFRTRGSGNTILVLTHGDSIDKDTEVTGTPSEKKQVAKIEAEMKALRDDKTKWKQDERQKGKDPDEKYELGEKISRVIGMLKQKKAEKQARQIGMRNRRVLQEMKKLYRDATGDPVQLAAFAVGNKAYQTYTSGYDENKPPVMTVEDTCIPQLRRSIYLMPTEGRLRDQLHLAEVQLPSLLNSFELFCAKVHMECKSEIEAIVLEPKNSLPQIVTIAFVKLQDEVGVKILSPMRIAEAVWVKDARKVCREWERKYPKNHLAILKRDGIKNMKGKNAKAINWNQELLDLGKDYQEKIFADFLKGSVGWLEQVSQDVEALSNATRAKISKDRRFSIMALGPFLRSFRIEKDNVRRFLDDVLRKLTREIGIIMEKAIVYSDDAYLTKAMLPIYDNIRKVKGKGAPKERMRLIERRVASMDGVWIKVHNSIDEALKELFLSYSITVVTGLEKIFDGIHLNFQLLCAHTEAKTEEEAAMEDILREQLLENLDTVKQMLGPGGEVTDLVAKCKNYQPDQKKGT